MTNQIFYYLASPYSDPDPSVRQNRYNAVNRAALLLRQQGKLVYSPLSHNIPIYEVSNIIPSWEICEAFDKAMMQKCNELLVLTLPGWDKSKGVSAEIEYAKQLKLPINMISPLDMALI